MTRRGKDRASSKSALATLLASVCALLAGVGAFGQSTGLEPNHGSLELTVGFLPDPQSFEVRAGGGEGGFSTAGLGLIDGVTGSACGSFYITEAPTVRLVLSDASTGTGSGTGFRFLRLFLDVPAGSILDPALLVRKPDGLWRCQEDSRVDGYAGLMPVIDFTELPAGDYEIWVGAYNRGVAKPAVLVLTSHRANLPTSGGY